MAIAVVRTRCGKQISVTQDFLGKRMTCPKCGNTFLAARMGAGKTGAQARTPRVHVSKGIILLIAAAIVLPTIFAGWRLGPGKVQDDLTKMRPDAEEEIKDVVTRGIQSYIEHEGMFDSSKSHNSPHALDVNFLLSPMYLTMPDSIGFGGSSTQGAFAGQFHPKTHEIDANVEIGGLAFSGTGAVRRGEKTIHVTGRNKNGVVTFEVDGKRPD